MGVATIWVSFFMILFNQNLYQHMRIYSLDQHQQFELHLLRLLHSSQKTTAQSNHRFIENCYIWNWTNVRTVSIWSILNWTFNFRLFAEKPAFFFLWMPWVIIKFATALLTFEKCFFSCRLLDNNKIDHLPPNMFQDTNVSGNMWVTEITTVNEVTRNCFQYLFRNVLSLTVLNMSRKIQIRERKLTKS